MILTSTRRALGCRQNLPNPQNPQSLPSPLPILRRDIIVFLEHAVSESPRNLEFEPEWCSTAVLSSISAITERVHSPTTEIASEPLTANLTELETAPNTVPAPMKPARSAFKPRSDAKSSRAKQSPHSTRTKRLVAALRSRRVRIAAIAVSVVIVCGLTAMNWKSGSSDSRDDIAEVDLSEFNSTSGFDEPRIGKLSEPRPEGVISDTESVSATDRFPPLGMVTHAGHAASRGQSAAGLVPASASFSGFRGAALTGQIEFETLPRSTEVPARSF